MVGNVKDKKFNADKVFNVVNVILVTFTFLIVLYPLYYIFICSFSSGAAISANLVNFYPVGFTFDGYKAIWEYGLLTTGFINTVFYTACGTCVNLVITVLAAYPLSRKELFGRNQITMYFAFTMWFGGGLIPTYLLYKDLGLIDTRMVMIVTGALSIWNMVITRTYFQKSIPEELLESAQLDGCSDFIYLIKIVLPLAKPILAVITLYYAVGHWNNYFNAMIYLNTPSLYSLQLILRDILVIGQASLIASNGSMSAADILYRENLSQMLKYSVIVVSAIPMLAMYPFVQKHFVKGIMVGALKG
ncbi:MAG: carbohydrate ABC transporter permease [Lachnospiraceae bacterium]